MLSAQRLSLFLAWSIGIAFTLIGVFAGHPILLSLRGPKTAALYVAGLAAVALLTTCGYWRGGRWLVVLWLLPPLAILPAIASFEFTKYRVLQTSSQLRRELGGHFVVGYSSFDDVAQLAAKGLIGGVYVTGSNVAGKDRLQIRAEIAALQARRRDAGWPPLIVATDQEGGAVSHLSPPLRRLPLLSTLAELPPGLRAEKAEELGRAQGRELASIGVTLDFAPVLDLKPRVRSSRLDINTRIAERAISSDPAVVSEIGRAFVRGMEAAGVGATVKHFPGLEAWPATPTSSAPSSIRRSANSKPPTGGRSGRCWRQHRRN
jgi:beta-N-acetylhexosaminidase